MELDLGLTTIFASWVFFFSFLFLLLGCGFESDLIRVGLWVVACGGAELWVLIVVVVEWVAMLYGFQIFFFFLVGFI